MILVGSWRISKDQWVCETFEHLFSHPFAHNGGLPNIGSSIFLFTIKKEINMWPSPIGFSLPTPLLSPPKIKYNIINKKIKNKKHPKHQKHQIQLPPKKEKDRFERPPFWKGWHVVKHQKHQKHQIQLPPKKEKDRFGRPPFWKGWHVVMSWGGSRGGHILD